MSAYRSQKPVCEEQYTLFGRDTLHPFWNIECETRIAEYPGNECREIWYIMCVRKRECVWV